MHKEHVIKLITGTLDGHQQSPWRTSEFCDGIKHVRELVDQEFRSHVHPDELMEFCVGIICSVQPESPSQNHLLTEVERGILAAAYFVYTIVHPLEYSPA